MWQYHVLGFWVRAWNTGYELTVDGLVVIRQAPATCYTQISILSDECEDIMHICTKSIAIKIVKVIAGISLTHATSHRFIFYYKFYILIKLSVISQTVFIYSFIKFGCGAKDAHLSGAPGIASSLWVRFAFFPFCSLSCFSVDFEGFLVIVVVFFIIKIRTL